ncbi:hypothetical protein ACROYT_G030387 [Oculina patagonica]
MLKGAFNLTKWTSNNREVLESIPVEVRTKDVKELDFDNDVLPTERALGVSWFVQTNTFGFKVNIKEKPCTRREILSVSRFLTRKQETKQRDISQDDKFNVKELENAEREILKFFQIDAFSEELEAVKSGTCVKKTSALASLQPQTILLGRSPSLRSPHPSFNVESRFLTRKQETKQRDISQDDKFNVKELENAEREILKFFQIDAFSEELEAVKSGTCVKKTSALASLQPQTILLGRSPSLRSPHPSFNVEVYLETSITAYCLS